MNCKKYEPLIDDLVEGELDDLTADEVSLHIFACSACTSQLELLESEKELYSRYLFEIEPPNDLLTKFQHKLEAQETETVLVAQTFFGFSQWTSKMFAFLRLNPILSSSFGLIVFAIFITLLNLGMDEQPIEKVKFAPIQVMLPNIPVDTSDPNPSVSKKDDIAKNKGKENIQSKIVAKPIAIKEKTAQLLTKELPKKTKQKQSQSSIPDEQTEQLLAIRSLETETEKQIEKVELLLRSFRNARIVEGGEMYDIAYEKQQARKLLDNNVILRQKAELYGTLFTEEMLNKVEPYLLDIANLDADATAEKVLEIKQRVKNQNIIASLQAF